MKNTSSKSSKVEAKPAEIVAQISAAQKKSDLAKKKAQGTKVIFKRARKAYKLAKKAAKAARSEVKELKKTLKIVKAAAVRARTAAKRKSSKASKPTRGDGVAASAAIEPTPVVPMVIEAAAPTESAAPQS